MRRTGRTGSGRPSPCGSRKDAARRASARFSRRAHRGERVCGAGKQTRRRLVLAQRRPVLDARGGDEMDLRGLAAHRAGCRARRRWRRSSPPPWRGAWPCVLDQILGLGGEADDEARALGSRRWRWSRECRGSSASLSAVSTWFCFFNFCVASSAARQSATAAAQMAMSAGSAASVAASISCAVSTFTTVTPAGSGSATGPLTSVTSAPSAAAALAKAWPCLPEERLAI